MCVAALAKDLAYMHSEIRTYSDVIYCTISALRLWRTKLSGEDDKDLRYRDGNVLSRDLAVIRY